MKKFKLGDRVIVDYSNQSVCNHVKDEAGTIVYVPEDSTYLVKCDNEIGTFSLAIFADGYKSDKNDLIWVKDENITLENK